MQGRSVRCGEQRDQIRHLAVGGLEELCCAFSHAYQTSSTGARADHAGEVQDDDGGDEEHESDHEQQSGSALSVATDRGIVLG